MDLFRKLKKVRLKDIVSLCLLATAYPCALFLKLIHKDIWLISERPNDAQDNGYYLFKYIRGNYPEKKAYYSINYNSVDFQKVKPLGNYIKFGSLKHYVYYLAANKNISSQIGTGEPNGQLCLNLEILGIIKNKKIFLQHGVISNILNFALFKNTKIKLFICGAEPEFNFVKDNFGYPLSSVKYLGLCRFDSLHNFEVNKKQILIMPTWRQWLDKDEKVFLESEYYKTYSELLRNKEFLEFLNQNELTAIFYPHDNVQKFIKYFKSDSENIVIADKIKYDVQQLLKNSALLITDYSSVFFDFAYMRKPIIYYQFDIKEFRQNHYAEGYFKYESDSFGPVCYRFSDVISQLNNYFICDFNISNQEFEKIEKFFPLYDRENCQRTFKEIQKL